MAFEKNRIWRAMRTGWHLRGADRADPAHDAPITRLTSPAGTEYDLYEPEGSARRTILAVAGLTAMGERDHRLVQLSRVLARAGVRVAAVALPGLKDCREDLGDLRRIQDLMAHLSRPGAPVGVLGFSFGGGYALAAAAAPELRGRVDPVVVFGPHHRMDEIWQDLARRRPDPAAPERVWRDDLYAWFVLALRAREALGLSAGELEQLRGLMRGFCSAPSPQQERDFFERSLSHRPVGQEALRAMDRATLEALSPAGKLAGLRARVVILTDPEDQVVPPAHSRRLMGELSARGVPDGERLLVTPLLSHVTVRSIWRVGDLARLLDAMGALFDDPTILSGDPES